MLMNLLQQEQWSASSLLSFTYFIDVLSMNEMCDWSWSSARSACRPRPRKKSIIRLRFDERSKQGIGRCKRGRNESLENIMRATMRMRERETGMQTKTFDRWLPSFEENSFFICEKSQSPIKRPARAHLLTFLRIDRFRSCSRRRSSSSLRFIDILRRRFALVESIVGRIHQVIEIIECLSNRFQFWFEIGEDLQARETIVSSTTQIERSTWKSDLILVSKTRLWLSSNERSNGWEYWARRAIIPVSKRLTCREFWSMFSNFEKIVRRKGPEHHSHHPSIEWHSSHLPTSAAFPPLLDDCCCCWTVEVNNVDCIWLEKSAVTKRDMSMDVDCCKNERTE